MKHGDLAHIHTRPGGVCKALINLLFYYECEVFTTVEIPEKENLLELIFHRYLKIITIRFLKIILETQEIHPLRKLSWYKSSRYGVEQKKIFQFNFGV